MFLQTLLDTINENKKLYMRVCQCPVILYLLHCTLCTTGERKSCDIESLGDVHEDKRYGNVK